jgi:hypothetical protein
VVEVEILESARKHKLSDDTIRYCEKHRMRGTLLRTNPDSYLYACWDQNCNFVELGIREIAGKWEVFHANKLQRKNRYLIKLEEV